MESHKIPPYPVSPSEAPHVQADNPWSTEDSSQAAQPEHAPSQLPSYSTIERKPLPQHTSPAALEKVPETLQAGAHPSFQQQASPSIPPSAAGYSQPEPTLPSQHSVERVPTPAAYQAQEYNPPPPPTHSSELPHPSTAYPQQDYVPPQYDQAGPALPPTSQEHNDFIPPPPQHAEATYLAQLAYEHQELIPPPLHPSNTSAAPVTQPQQPNVVQGLSGSSLLMPPAPPPRRISYQGDRDISDPLHYTRDPKKLIAYLIPLPKPSIPNAESVPTRFLIYTPPAPPLYAPPEGSKEGKVHKVQRKWETEVREAKASKAKVTSWKGVKSRATKGINWGMNAVKDSNLEFLNRVPPSAKDPADNKHSAPKEKHDIRSDDGPHESTTTSKTVGLEEMVLIYPSDFPETQEQIRKEFVDSMLRTKSKAQRDAIIATGLWPVALTIDVLAGPFGGLAEIDGVWAYASIRGAKTARSVTKRLMSTGDDEGHKDEETHRLIANNAEQAGEKKPQLAQESIDEMYGPSEATLAMEKASLQNPTNTQTATPTAPSTEKLDKGPKLKLTFTPSPRVSLLSRYLAAECNKANPKLFPTFVHAPVESDIISAIGWSPSQTGGQTRNWEDEQWELQEVKDDLRQVFGKGAKEWGKWVKGWEKKLEKERGKERGERMAEKDMGT